MLRLCITVIYLFISKFSVCQTCCTAGAPINSSLEISSSDAKTIGFQLGYEYKAINTLVDGDNVLQNDDRSRYGQNLTFKIDYTLSKKIAFSIITPIVHQSRNTFSDQQNSLGVGDITIITQYNIISKNGFSWISAGGLKLPTGITNHIDDATITLSPDMQSGSGSLDFVVRTSLTNENIFFPFLTAVAEMVYRVNGVNQNFAQSTNFIGRQFSFGDELIGQIGFKYLLVMSKGFVVPDLSFKYRNQKANSEQGFEAPNSGGYWMSIPWGVSIVPDKEKSFRVYLEHPLYQKLDGLQITNSITVGLQLNYRIN